MAFASSSANNARGKGKTYFTLCGLPISTFSILLTFIASMGGFIFVYHRSTQHRYPHRSPRRNPTADFFGRRNAMSLECGVFVSGVLMQITTFNTWYQFAAGWLVAGFGVGALSAVVPMYQAESAHYQIRGTFSAMFELFNTFGDLVAYCISIVTDNINNSSSWRTVVGTGIAWALALGVGIRFMRINTLYF